MCTNFALHHGKRGGKSSAILAPPNLDEIRGGSHHLQGGLRAADGPTLAAPDQPGPQSGKRILGVTSQVRNWPAVRNVQASTL